MKILVVGSGGREHALCWKIRQSPLCDRLYCAPGNPGIAALAECVPISVMDFDAIVSFCARQDIDLVVVGPEAPLVGGLVNVLNDAGIRAFGPQADAAALEGSKAFMKAVCVRAGVPTAKHQCFRNFNEADDFLETVSFPVVIKASGLAAGKGVTICGDYLDARSAIENAMVHKRFGESGEEVIIEEYLDGVELSYFVIADGVDFVPLASAHDYKRVFDGDKGGNTGGMGAVSPTPRLDAQIEREIIEQIIRPTLVEMSRQGKPFRGVLYAGIMVTSSGPKLIEYNVRFGDPECQALMVRLESDLVHVLLASAEGNISGIELAWRDAASICVVIASEGYPDTPKTGGRLTLPATLGDDAHTLLFHAGTQADGDHIHVAGGRVLNICASDARIDYARESAYRAVSAIRWPGCVYRSDIGLN